ncbi:MAG: GYD domain-containing protein [Chromatiales bacterium]
MATYVLLTTLTPEGRQTLHKNPDRLLEVNKEVEQFGCKVIAQYAVLGSYDFVSVVEAPDNETAAHLSVDLGSRGTVNIMTLPAMHVDAFLAKLKGPKQMGHR